MRTICLFLSGISLSACAHAKATIPPAPEEETSESSSTADAETAQREYAAMKYAGRHSFDRGAAAGTLGDAKRNLPACWHPNDQPGTGHAKITFTPDGHASDVDIDEPPFDTAPSNICIKTIFYRATVPPFEGGPVPVGVSFALGVDERSDAATDETAAKQAVSELDFADCNPHNYEKPGFYRASISFAQDGSVATVEPTSVPPGEDATCIVAKIRAAVRMPAHEGRWRWVKARIYLPLSMNPAAVNP